MCKLNELIGTCLCKIFDNTEKDMSIGNSNPNISNNDNELSKLSKKLEYTRGAYAFAKELGDEKRMAEKLELCFSLEKEIYEILA